MLACRPATLTAAMAPVVVGTAASWAAGAARVAPALAALFGALMIQIGTNLANDVFDFEKGADTAARLGPLRATQAGLLTPSEVRRGMWLAMALATAAGVYLVAVAGWPVVAIGVASVLSGIAYTGGPYPLGYHGLGDVFVLVFFGLVAVCGTAFVQVGRIPVEAWMGSIPVGAVATAVLVVNNLRDRGTDAVAGKRTLVVRWGRTAGLVEYALLLLMAHLVPVGAALWLQRPWLALGALTAPVAVLLARGVSRSEGAALNPYLGKPARLLLLQSLVLAAGIAMSRPGP
ncbi:MAG: 1,4-dihydroxy-2-naphthoate polyprenyltransferase [Polyangiaceae bacterium]